MINNDIRCLTLYKVFIEQSASSKLASETDNSSVSFECGSSSFRDRRKTFDRCGNPTSRVTTDRCGNPIDRCGDPVSNNSSNRCGGVSRGC